MLDSGDSTLIVTPKNKTILIDAGNGVQDTLTKYLLARKIKKIDYLLISHFDVDHCNGAIDLFDKIKIKNLIIGKQSEISKEFKNIINLAEKNNTKILIVKKGDLINVDEETNINILYPENNLKYEDLNNNSLVTKISYNNFSILFTGDIENSEKDLVNLYKEDLKSTILKVSHHGAKKGTSQEFLNEVNPQIALIGVSKNNTYGHPSVEVLERLNKKNIKILPTSIYGEIIIKVNKKGELKIRSKL